MELNEAVREALELQILEESPEPAAATIGIAVGEHGAATVAGMLLDAAGVVFRKMVDTTEEAYDLAELLAQLALDGAVPEHRLELLGDMLTASAAIAGGIRPPVEALHTRLGDQDLLFGALARPPHGDAGGVHRRRDHRDRAPRGPPARPGLSRRLRPTSGATARI